MALSISKALNIKNEERSVVYLLLIQSVFLGIFAGALDVGANALFLEAYSADMMPGAFMISGAVGIVFTLVYTFLQKKLPFKAFTVLNLLIAILFTALLRVGYGISEDPRLAFALLVMMGPLIIITMLGFWGTAGRYFALRDGKRLFGIIDTGSVVGMILAFYALPVLVQFNFNVYNTLLIGLISLVAALLFQIIVLQKHKIIVGNQMITKKKEKKSGFFSIFRNRYTSMMAFFVVLSVITGFFIHYSFMWATEANYPDNRELTGFLGAFFGTMMILTVIIKSTLYSWLMKNYGLKVTLLISPALLLILTIIASLVGGFFGYAAESGSFTFFFLVIALSKLFNKALKDSIESPSMKILYQSLDSDERFDVQARIDGVVNELTAFAAGLLMAGLLLLNFIHVIHFSYILIAVLVIWVILGFTLYNLYRKKLNDSLVSARAAAFSGDYEETEEYADFSGTPMYSDLIRIDPYFYQQINSGQLDSLLKSSDLRMQHFSWEIAAANLHVCEADLVNDVLNKNTDPELAKSIHSFKKRFHLPGKNIENAFRSADKDIRLSALIQTVVEQDAGQISHIITLLRDRDLQVRSAAIEAAGKLKAKELGSYLVDYLGHPELYNITWSAMVNMGELVLENLENVFHKTGVHTSVQLRIVNAMIAIGGEKANNFLFNKISYHQRDIREAAINGLYRNDFLPSAKSQQILHALIYELVLSGAMNIAAEFAIRENNPENGLLEAISEERIKNDKLLFTLLGISYEKSAIKHVQESIENKEKVDTGFALELLNLIVDDQAFAYLEPYFDDISVGEKIRRLQYEMSVEIQSYDEVLVDLLNRDSLFTGNYLRIVAIDALRQNERANAVEYLAAQVFHPNPTISRSAALVLAEKDYDLHLDIVKRLRQMPSSGKESFNNLDVKLGEEVIEIVEDLKSWDLFKAVDREILFRLVSEFENQENVNIESAELVSLIRSDSMSDRQLYNGLLINLSDYPSKLEQMRYIASLPNLTFYQVKRKVLRELLFDIPELRDTFRFLFRNTEISEIIT